MIDGRISPNECSGCKACGDVCSYKAITFMTDSKGFWHPKVNNGKCVKCGMCIKVCPLVNMLVSNTPVSCYGAWNKNPKIRNESTSGGLFSAFAEKWLKEGGECCAAVYKSNNVVKHEFSTVDDLSKMRKSKYVQSDTEGIYRSINEKLEREEKILFCGTPCQVAALKKFLKKEYSNLFTVDFICCGVPSPLAFSSYLEMLEKKFASKIKCVWFKNKKNGWHNWGTQIEFLNNKEYYRSGNRDLYMVAYIDDGLTIRESCLNCQFRRIPHVSDVTLGDFWGIEDTYPQYNDDKGTSAVIINSNFGKRMFENIKDDICYFETDINKIAYGNLAMLNSKSKNKNQDLFFKLIRDENFDKAMKKFGSYKGIKKINILLQFVIKTIYRKLVKK